MPPLLPFLYPSLIVRQTLHRRESCRFLRLLHSSGSQLSPQRPLRPLRQLRQRSPSNPQHSAARGRRSPTNRDHIPFDLPPDVAEELAKAELERARIEESKWQGTITPMERRAFQRIFQEIGTRKEGSTADESVDSKPPGMIRGSDEMVPSQDLVNAIIHHATEEVNQNPASSQENTKAIDLVQVPRVDSIDMESSRRRKVLEQLPNSLRQAASAAMGVPVGDGGRGSDEMSAKEAQQKIEQMIEQAPKPSHAAMLARSACRRRQVKMEREMSAIKSDFALWDYMEERVFTLVDEFGIQRNKGESPKKKKGSKGRGHPLHASSEEPLSNRLPPEEALATYAPLYPALLLHGVRLLDGRFGSSTLALGVLPRVKAYGLASYVLGASTALFNAQLRIRWRRHGDWNGCLALLEEMQQVDVPFDHQTAAVMNSMQQKLSQWKDNSRPSLTVDSLGTHPADSLAVAAGRLFWMTGLDKKLAYWKSQVKQGAEKEKMRLLDEKIITATQMEARQ